MGFMEFIWDLWDLIGIYGINFGFIGYFSDLPLALVYAYYCCWRFDESHSHNFTMLKNV